MTFLEFANNHAALVVFGAVAISIVVMMGSVILVAILCDLWVKKGEDE